MLTCVIDRNGNPLMPTYNIRKVRRMLKAGKAVICGHDPFAVQLTYDIPDAETQPVELTEDTGYLYIGISVKSEKHEFLNEERKALPDEKEHHQAQKRIRMTRRNRKRYRKPRNKRAANSYHIQEEWLAPSLRHKADIHVAVLEKYRRYFPITEVTLEMGQFDTQVLAAVNEGRPVPEGCTYQHGPSYGFDTLREAIFFRDMHTCQCCKRSAVKDGRTLVLHHVGFRTRDRSNRMGNLLTLCTKCHIPSNHKPGGKLWDLKPKSGSLRNAAFMNSVKWEIHRRIKDILPDVHITYGAVTKRERLNRNIGKSHGNDAYCIGRFHPRHRAKTIRYAKRRRNNRCLEKFYDAKYTDIRDGRIKKAAELGCNRTNRTVPRHSPDNLRRYRGRMVSKGRRVIRKTRHPIQAGDIVLFKNRKHTVRTSRTRTDKTGRAYETVEFTDMKGEHRASETTMLHHVGGWKKVTEEEFYRQRKG